MTRLDGGTREKLSMIATVTNKSQARWMIIDSAFNADKLIKFLGALIRDGTPTSKTRMSNMLHDRVQSFSGRLNRFAPLPGAAGVEPAIPRVDQGSRILAPFPLQSTLNMSFLQFRIHNSRHPEFVDEALMVAGALSVSFIDAADDPVLEPGPGETPLWTDTVVLGLFDPAVAVDEVENTLRTLVPDGADLRLETELLEDQDWVRAWLAHWEPLRFGRRLWVTPEEKRAQIPAQPDAVIMTLDPGLAFGTGTHPTTALCLAWLDAQDLAGKTVIDYGCGSGILAIAALLLDAERVVCVDIDPQALTATRQNAETNGVADRIATCLPEAFAAAPADFVLANILAGPLKTLAPTLAGQLKPGGRLVLAGLLDRQAEELHACYAPYLRFEPDLSLEGWTRIAGQRLQDQA